MRYRTEAQDPALTRIFPEAAALSVEIPDPSVGFLLADHRRMGTILTPLPFVEATAMLASILVYFFGAVIVGLTAWWACAFWADARAPGGSGDIDRDRSSESLPPEPG
ncbi:MAG: hypothetical protein ACXWJU_08835 [Hyphomicrobium sp.]